MPGVGRGDIVPAMLTPGEGVMPKPVMDGLKQQAEHGNMNAKGDTHVHVHYRPTVHAMDGASVARVLDKHSDKFEAHLVKVLRGRNL